jgi:hypothetical protein
MHNFSATGKFCLANQTPAPKSFLTRQNIHASTITSESPATISHHAGRLARNNLPWKITRSTVTGSQDNSSPVM